MADDENTPAPPTSEAEGPPPVEPHTAEGKEKAGEEEAAVKQPAKKAAPRKKAARTKAAKAETEESTAAAVAADSGRNAEKTIKTAKDTEPGKPANKPQTPPKRFWWRALLMIAAVIFLFSIIRDMAKAPGEKTASRENAPAIVSTMPDEVGSSGDIVIEEAPSQPPADFATPAPGNYSYPYQPPFGMYRWPQQGGMPGQPMYPMTPYGGYAYPYPWSAPYSWSPYYYYYWSPLYYPWAQPAPEEQ